jgi:hypothetical protein
LIRLGSHGRMRMRQRVGKKGHRANNKVNMAFIYGIPRESLRGELRSWVDRHYFNHDLTRIYKVYTGVMYVFSKDGGFVTCVQIPHNIYIRAKQGENRKKKRL